MPSFSLKNKRHPGSFYKLPWPESASFWSSQLLGKQTPVLLVDALFEQQSDWSIQIVMLYMYVSSMSNPEFQS